MDLPDGATRPERERGVSFPVPRDLAAARFTLDREEFVVFAWRVAPPEVPPGLTAAERDVAALAVAGLSNEEIGRVRGRAGRTVANQVASVFRKLGVGSRAELAARCACRR